MDSRMEVDTTNSLRNVDDRTGSISMARDRDRCLIRARAVAAQLETDASSLPRMVDRLSISVSWLVLHGVLYLLIVSAVARAKFMYQAAIPEELTFAKGDTLAVLRHQDDGWWEAEVVGRGGRAGLVPSNYLSPGT